MWKVEFSHESLAEVQDALNYFLEKSAELSEDFIQDLEKGIFALQVNPYYQVRYKNIRCLPLSKFPFMIHFELDEDKKRVKILSCIHTSLNPNKSWR